MREALVEERDTRVSNGCSLSQIWFLNADEGDALRPSGRLGACHV